MDRCRSLRAGALGVAVIMMVLLVPAVWAGGSAETAPATPDSAPESSESATESIESAPDAQTQTLPGEQMVLATNAWTAAFARAAGAQNIELLAPYEMRHPAEYELRATDLQRVEQADLVVYAGYEGMIDRLQNVLGSANVNSVQITTTHTPEVMTESVMRIATELGTEETARANLAEIEAFFDDWSAELASHGLQQSAIITHAFQAQMLGALGVEPVGRYGPGPLEAQQIGALSGAGATLIVDNWHNEVGTPFRETLPDALYVSWINFPGHAGTRTLLDVFTYNRAQLNKEMSD